jgi:hypothetical protein
MSVFPGKIFLSVAAAGWLLLPSGAEADSPHTAAQSGAIKLGTTGSTQAPLVEVDPDTGEEVELCFAGTLGGAVVDSNGNLFILSNNHVLAQTNTISPGEPIIHPASLDSVCKDPLEDPKTVATLTDFVDIKFCQAKGPLLLRCKNNTVDAAIAAVEPDMVASDGYILDIGPTGSTPASAYVGMKVQKSGRSTGYTTGTVAAVDVSVLVCYALPCTVAANLANFVNQVRVGPAGFSGLGDSGSMILECKESGGACDPSPAPVGLLFAGGDGSTFFNRFEDVQSAFGVAPVGCDAACFGGDDGGGGGGGGNGGGPGGGGPPGRNKSVLGVGLELASEVRAAYEDELLQRRGVQGTGISVDEFGNSVIEVYVKDATGEADNPIPSDLEGIPVRVIVTGQIRAY